MGVLYDIPHCGYRFRRWTVGAFIGSELDAARNALSGRRLRFGSVLEIQRTNVIGKQIREAAHASADEDMPGAEDAPFFGWVRAFSRATAFGCNGRNSPGGTSSVSGPYFTRLIF